MKEIVEYIIKEIRAMFRTVFLLMFLLFVALFILFIIIYNNFESRKARPKTVEKYEEVYNQRRVPQEVEQQTSTFKFIPHRVQPGETLETIANKYGTYWRVIQKVNKISEPEKIRPGEVLIIPVKVLS